MSLSRFWLSILSCTLAAGAHANSQAPQTPVLAGGADSFDRTLQLYAESQSNGFGRVEVTLGQLDSRLRLAPCARFEPYVPPGVRLWGRSYIGVRCVEGARWNVMMPVTVKVYGKALIATAPLPAGAPINDTDVEEQEVELTRDPTPPMTDRALLEGKTLVRGVVPGQAIRPEYLRVLPTVAAGDPVRLELVGTGFSVAASGQAMSAGGEGQSVRVRTDAGRVLSGVIRNGKTVEIRL
jgi:flagella basal body P-ring formation protein FlgA